MKKVFEHRINRRSFIKYSLRLSVLASVGVGYSGRNDLTTEHVQLNFSNLPPSFNGFRIVQISDLHASFWVGERYLKQVIRKINELDKDLVVITGDFITGSVNDFWKRWIPAAKRDYLAMLIDVLKNLKNGPKMAVLGNHDQWDGIETERRLVHGLEKIGVSVLRNRSMPLTRGKEKIYISGTDDVWFSYNLTKALRDIPRNAFKILLSHSPDVNTDIKKEMKIDLTLCGHTHGAQVNIPYLSYHVLPIDNPSRYIAGLVKEPHGYTYVNRGIGTLVFPFRIAAPPEITCIKLDHLQKS